MLANWFVGKHCDPSDFGEKLKFAPFDCVVVVVSDAVVEEVPIFKYLRDLVSGNPANAKCVAEVLSEKAVYHLCDNIYVALHRAKIKSCHYTPWSTRSRGASSLHFEFGSLVLHLDSSRQRMEYIRVGLVDLRTRSGRSFNESDAEALVEWVVVDRVAVLTGFFGQAKNFVEKLAKDAGAIYKHPLYQGVQCRPWEYYAQATGAIYKPWEYYALPTYFLLFGFHRAINLPDLHTVVPDHMAMGDDIMWEMISWEEIPAWPASDNGSAFAPNLGNIKMKPVDYNRWFSHAFQTCLWLGTSKPNNNSLANEQHRSRGKGPRKGKHKGKGMGKGYSTGEGT